MAIIYLDGFQSVWDTTDNIHGEVVQKLVKFVEKSSGQCWNKIADELTAIEDELVDVKWAEEQKIFVEKSCVGKIILLDLKPNTGLSTVMRTTLQNISRIVALAVQMKQEILRNSIDIIADVLHDIRTPVMALNMNVSVLHQLQDGLNSITSIKRDDKYFGSSDEQAIISTPLSFLSAKNIQRSVDSILTAAMFISQNVEDYASLRKSYLLIDSLSKTKNFISCDIGHVIEESYNTVHSIDYSKRYLCVDRAYFQKHPMIAYPDALHLLFSLTMKRLQLKYEYVSVCVYQTNKVATMDIDDIYPDVLKLQPSSSASTSSPRIPCFSDQINEYQERQVDKSTSFGSRETMVTIRFRCSQVMDAKSLTSENKEKRIQAEIQRLLRVYHGNIRLVTSPALELPRNSRDATAPISGRTSTAIPVVPCSMSTPSQLQECPRKSINSMCICPAAEIHDGKIDYDFAYELPFNFADCTSASARCLSAVEHQCPPTTETSSRISEEDRHECMMVSVSGNALESSMEFPLLDGGQDALEQQKTKLFQSRETPLATAATASVSRNRKKQEQFPVHADVSQCTLLFPPKAVGGTRGKAPMALALPSDSSLGSVQENEYQDSSAVIGPHKVPSPTSVSSFRFWDTPEKLL